MMWILRQLKKTNHWLGLLLFILLLPTCAIAQTDLTVSVSPTLIKVSADPSQSWQSAVRVVNPNSYPITISTDVVDFIPEGESGQVEFIPLGSDTGSTTLASWISLHSPNITIDPETTAEIPFTVVVPATASPGSHYAALLLGAEAASSGEGQSQVETSQVITALLFVRVSGEVIERGSIREFTAEQSFYSKPTVTFALRFENHGTVALQPQGEIKIFNMWGKERGVVPVNRQTLFGSVLDESIRRYVFSWEGDWSFGDIGRYTAVATLAYGEVGRQFVSAETHFWVIPWRLLSIILLIVGLLVAAIVFGIRLYVRRMLALAGVPTSMAGQSVAQHRVSVAAPFEAGLLDLRNRLRSHSALSAQLRQILRFIIDYRVFVMATLSLIALLYLLLWYALSVSVEDRPYEVTIGEAADQLSLSSEEVAYSLLRPVPPSHNQVAEQVERPQLAIVNHSRTAGVAAALRVALEDAGYTVSKLKNDIGVSREKTVIVYHPEVAAEALTLSQLLAGAPLSVYPEADREIPITIYVGKNHSVVSE